MDNLTHSLVGALIGQTGLKRKTGLAMPALIIGANLPDIDATCVLLGNMQHLALRRGITHGPIAWVLLPLVLAGALWWFDRWQAGRGKRPDDRVPVRFGWLYALAFIACLTHPALDWLNSYGIRLLEPFSDRWFYGDTLFIIDVWLWAGLGFATWLSRRREKKTGGNWRRPARLALVGAVAYIGMNLAWSENEERNGKVDALLRGINPDEAIIIASPLPLMPWKRQLIIGANGRWFSRERLSYDHIWIRPMTEKFCDLPDTGMLEQDRPDLAAFMFWSRAPFAERAEDGSVVIHDARFYDPRINSRFYVALPEVRCEPKP